MQGVGTQYARALTREESEAARIAAEQMVREADAVEPLLHDRIQQELAEIGLHTMRAQYPARILADPPHHAFGAAARIDQVVGELGPYRLAQNLAEPPRDGLVSIALKEGLEGRVLSLKRKLSEGTAQGTVYLADIRVAHPRRGVAHVPAVVKKSAIVDPALWAKHKEQGGEKLNAAVRQQLTDPENGAYVDALGDFYGSRLVEAGLSSFYALMYGAFRAHDLTQNGLPVQVALMQPLQRSMYDAIEEGWFQDAKRADLLDLDKLESFWAQQVFGLAGGQRFFGIVQNDYHGGNTLYERAPREHINFYEHAGQLYAVPTLGRIWKQIDFGRAAFDYLGAHGQRIRMGNHESEEVYREDWDIHGTHNDLLRLMTTFLLMVAPDGDAELARKLPPGPRADRFLAFVRNVLTCEEGNIFALAAQCNEEKQCTFEQLDLLPFVRGSACGAVPSRNIAFFDSLRVPPSSLPPLALVYPA